MYLLTSSPFFRCNKITGWTKNYGNYLEKYPKFTRIIILPFFRYVLVCHYHFHTTTPSKQLNTLQKRLNAEIHQNKFPKLQNLTNTYFYHIIFTVILVYHNFCLSKWMDPNIMCHGRTLCSQPISPPPMVGRGLAVGSAQTTGQGESRKR